MNRYFLPSLTHRNAATSIFYALALISLTGTLCLPTVAFSQEDEEDELPEFLPGLIGDYTVTGGSFRRLDEDLLFHGQAEAWDPRVSPGEPLRVRWSGLLQVKEHGQFQLRVFAAGQVTVRLAGQEILATQSERATWLDAEPVDLRFGRHALEIEYASEPGAARLGLYWSGPSFELEPIAPRFLQHPSENHPDNAFEIGRQLSRALRCAACHEVGSTQVAPMPGPALTHLQDNLRPSWLVAHLRAQPETGLSAPGDRRMPYFGLDHNSAAAISAALFDASQASPPPEDLTKQLQAAAQTRKKGTPKVRTTPDPQQGERTFVSTGCLACHQVGSLGASQDRKQRLFSGGDLSALATKRTRNFLDRWLSNPEQVNADHRMPIFDLSLNERLDLADYLDRQGREASRHDTRASGDVDLGVGLLQRHRCGACHQLPTSLRHQIVKTRLTADSDWDAGCLSAPVARAYLPGFALSDAYKAALRAYLLHASAPSGLSPNGQQLLVENNCLACHQRDLEPGVGRHLPAVAEAVPEVAPRLAALSPPAITGVGDKLTDEALSAAIVRKGEPLRPWLDVRMPRFSLAPQQLESITNYLIGHDRIPDYDPSPVVLPSDKQTELAAARLVTSDGFGCQSCHQIGKGDAPMVDLKARGTNLAMLGSRVRRTWFHRWVRNPARIVPRMEMPAVQTAAKGVLGSALDVQLEALWQRLNTPDFRPPRPNPVRVVRSYNQPDLREPSHVLTSVLESPEKVYLRPLIFGLPNRHNVLFDLEAGQLAAWWIGDTASQHTRGKTWYWEPGSVFMNEGTGFLEAVRVLDSKGRVWRPRVMGQVAVRLDTVRRVADGVAWTGRLNLSDGSSSREVLMRQTITLPQAGDHAFQVITGVELARGEQVFLQFPDTSHCSPGGECRLFEHGRVRVVGVGASVAFRGEHSLLVQAAASDSWTTWRSEYSTDLPPETFPHVALQPPPMASHALDCVPGFEAAQLPLPNTEMPISMAWDSGGEFYMGSLKGRVLQLHDDDDDGLHERYERISDELPTPYGLAVNGDSLDVLAKFALLRLSPPTSGGAIRDMTVVADGWGYTADYHDWAVGLERDQNGHYYLALPCQQDERTEAAAHWRGHALELIPDINADGGHRRYRIESISAGLRFPMGIARNADGDLFTTDNQGNYNPFNELNHLRRGKRYGFINRLENKAGFSPPLESPAINLPHPWSRSVNGICFLTTPEKVKKAGASKLFGAYEGHLLGCEMNGRFLVRMSLQQVGDTYQGAAYLFSRPENDQAATFEGPIVCEVSPSGDIYVGNLHDSGWGAGQNTGSLVRLRPKHNLPLGIAEVRAIRTGFEIDFTQAVDRALAAQAENYQIRSYRRISTPAYGGDDQDERNERVRSLQVSQDGRRVRLELDALRAGCVYELNLAALGPDGNPLFPSQAHYTMRAVP